MSTEDRLHRMMSNVGQSDVDQSTWSDFVTVAHRSHTKHRVVTAIAVVGAVAAASFGTAAVLNRESVDRDLRPTDQNFAPVPIPVDVPRDCPTAPDVTEGALGTVAYLGATELHVVDVASGDDSILVQAGPGFGEGFFSDEVRISPDGQWVSFGGGLMVPTAGGDVCAPLGQGVHDLQWTPNGGAVALDDGSLIVGGPGQELSKFQHDEFSYESFVLSSGGEKAAVSVVGENQQMVWVISTSSGQALKSFAGDATGVKIAGWWVAPSLAPPDQRWVLFWNRTLQDSESVNADGSPLRAVNLETGEVVTITDAMISERDQMAWCGDRLVFTDGPGRLVQDKKVIAGTQASSWDKEILGEYEGLSLTDPTCNEAGSSLAAIATPSFGDGTSALVRWAAGDEPSDAFAIGAGVHHPELSADGKIAVVEVTADRTGLANEVVKVEGGDTTTLGILGAQSSFPLVGGSPTWDWHRP